MFLGIFFFFSGSFWFLLAMMADFSFRLVSEGKHSPVIKLNSFLVENFKIKNIIINAGPKIFAARIGLLLTAFSLTFWIFNMPVASLATAGILVFFSFLESAFGFCVACKIYPYALVLNEIKVSKRS